MALFFFRFELNIPDNPTVGFLQGWCHWKDISKANPAVAVSGKSDGRISRTNRFKLRFRNTNCTASIPFNYIYNYIYKYSSFYNFNYSSFYNFNFVFTSNISLTP